MSCCVSEYHTVTLSNTGTVYSFGCGGNLGQGIMFNSSHGLVSPIANLPKIRMISCGSEFTFCVDYEGALWSFGNNIYGQLGTGDTSFRAVPHRINDIPPVETVSCGFEHALILTQDKNLWVVGANINYQLCLGNQENQLKLKQTQFSNIVKIAAGSKISIFQNNEGKLFGCGLNSNGELGLGHIRALRQVCLIPIPSMDIIDICCGYDHILYLDKEGNVYSVGYNYYGALGLGHNEDQHVINKIPNIPPIKMISCCYSSYLLDFDGNVWSFGPNSCGQLGHGDFESRNVPTKILSLSNIVQISNENCNSRHFFAKDDQNTIFCVGNNEYAQLGTGHDTKISIPQILNHEYSTIWGDPSVSNAKSARTCF